MALPTNGSGGGLPKRPQQGQQRDPRKRQQGLPAAPQGDQNQQGSRETPRKRPGEGLPSIPQSAPRQGDRQSPQQQRIRREDAAQAERRTQRPARQRPPEGARQRSAPPQQVPQEPRDQSPEPRRSATDPYQNRYDEGQDDPFESLDLDDVLDEDDDFDEQYDEDYDIEKSRSQQGFEDESTVETGFEQQSNQDGFAQAAREESQEPGMQENIGRYYSKVSTVRDEREATQEASLEGRNADREYVEQHDDVTPHDGQYTSAATKDAKNQDLYVDEEKEKLKTFGGNKKQKIKVNEYDERQNKEKRSKIVQYSVLGGIGALFLFSVIAVPITISNTVAPDEVQSLVQAETGGTGFPLNAGEGFAKDFMQAYLTYSGNDSIDNQALQYYQTGTLGASADSGNTGRNVSGNVRQDVVFGPTVYGVTDVTNYSATYTIGALVSAVSTEDEAPDDSNRTHWEFFQVNVYFDPEEERFYIPPQSPSLIPEYEMGARNDVPDADEIGGGSADEALTAEVQSVVHGFMRAWAESSPGDTAAIDQYIVSGETGDHLRDGFGNEYVFAGGDAESSITFQAYPNEAQGNVKVDMTVRWSTPITGADGEENSSVEYESTYVMTLVQQDDDRYLVSDFTPKVYISQEAAAGQG